MKIKESEWDSKNARIKNTASNSGGKNQMLLKKRIELEGKILDYQTNDQNPSIKSIKEKIHKSSSTDFFAFANKHLLDRFNDGKIGTHDKEKAVINKLKHYISSETLPFTHLDRQFILDYRDYLKNEIGNAPNTIHSNLRVIRMLLNKAEAEGAIKHEQNPFVYLKFKKAETQRAYLNEEELEKIKSLQLEKGSKIEIHRDLFVFSCYACGLRVSDVLLLQNKDVQEDHIYIQTKKTASVHRFKLLPEAKRILSNYARNASTEAFTFLC